MKVSATAALLAVSLVTISTGSAFAQAAGQAPQAPKPATPAPAQPPAATPTRVQTLTQKKQTDNTAKQKALQDNQQKLQSGGSVMSDAARDQLQKEIEKQQLELQRFQQDAQAEITELQNEVQNEFARKVQPLIDQMAKEKGLHMVFNAGDAGFAWVDAGLDLSSEIIKKLDAAKAGAAPKP